MQPPVVTTQVLAEGKCPRVMDIVPFSDAGPAIERLQALIEARTGLTGKQHEIDLSDTGCADPRTWTTLLRQPLKRRQR